MAGCWDSRIRVTSSTMYSASELVYSMILMATVFPNFSSVAYQKKEEKKENKKVVKFRGNVRTLPLIFSLTSF